MATNSGENDDFQADELERLAREEGLMPGILGEDGVTKILNSKRPKIKLPGDNRELGQFAAEIGGIVKDRHMYRRDRTAVIINEEKQRLDLVSAELLRTWVETHLMCFKTKGATIGQGEQEQKISIDIVRTMNLDAARGTLESNQFLLKLAEIVRINQTRLPVILKDGSIALLKPGYFPEQQIYTLGDGLKLNEGMTRAEACKVIDDRLKDFPFQNERSKAVTIAAMLTIFCATMLPKRALRPGFIYTANAPGAGKTLLTKFAIIPVVGSAETRTFPRKEEAKKVLDILAMDAANYILFDNIKGKISGEEIEAFITSAEWSGRILGESTKFRVDNVATVFMTGNQSTTSADMTERCLFVELFVQEADNRDRVIPRVIDDEFLARPEERAIILSALWALVRGWEDDGKPNCEDLKISPFPRFESWSNVVAPIVVCAGYGNPLEKPELHGAGDVETRDMRALVISLAPAADADERSAEYTFVQIVEKVRDLGLFEETELRIGRASADMFDEGGSISAAGKSFFGKLLGRKDRLVFRSDDGRRLRFLIQGKGANRRFIVADETGR